MVIKKYIVWNKYKNNDNVNWELLFDELLLFLCDLN